MNIISLVIFTTSERTRFNRFKQGLVLVVRFKAVQDSRQFKIQDSRFKIQDSIDLNKTSGRHAC